MIQTFVNMFKLEFMQNAFMAGIIISILCPVIGLFIVLRRNSMIGDTLSHSSFAGVAIGLVFGINPIFSAFLFTTACAVIIEALRGSFKKYAELVMSIVLTFSLGIAIIFFSAIKNSLTDKMRWDMIRLKSILAALNATERRSICGIRI